MNNYYQNYGAQCSSREYNPNNYDLWQNSHYYNTNNFGLHNIFFAPNFGWSADGVGTQTPEKEPEDVDSKNRRIIPRKALYEDPDAFYAQDESTDNQHKHQLSGHDWTQQSWRKAGEVEHGGSDVKPQRNVKTNVIQKKLNAALAQPVKMTKAESMMQKMGWSGGALGKDGEGIVEPIAPNAAYATKTIGFGQTEPETPKRFRKASFNKTNFKTNVLLHLLDFVKNDTETEVVFDRRLTKEERKSVHKIVNDVIGGMEEEEEMVYEIELHNHYVLGTQSEGTFPDRQLVVYKEAPAHVYLVTPDDLIMSDENVKENPQSTEKSNSETLAKSDNKKPQATNESQLNPPENADEETNPFLRSITRNLREKDVISNKLEDCNIASENQPYVLKKITEYFIEFATNDEYTEFRFLGPFLLEDIKILSGFVDDVGKCAKESALDVFKVDKKRMMEVFGNGKFFFEVKEDSNGSLLISKQTKVAAKEPDKL